MMKKIDESILCRKQFLIGNKFNFMMTIVMVLLSAVINIAIAFIMMMTIEAMEFSDMGRLKNTLIFVGLFVVIFLAFGIFQKVFKNRFMKQGLFQFKKYVFEKVLKKSIGEFGNTSSGTFINAFSNDLVSIEQNYLGGSIQIIMQVVLLVAAIIAMLYINWILMLCVAVVCILPIIVSLKYGKRITDKEKKTSDENEGFVDQVKDLLNGFIVIKSFKAEKEVLKLFNSQNTKVEEAKRDRRETNDTMNLIGGLSSTLVLVVLFGMGTYFVFKDIMTIGAVLAFVQLSNYILNPISELVPLWNNRKAAVGLIDKIADVIKDKNETDNKIKIDSFNNFIEMKNVSFSYEQDKPILHDINLQFEKGKSYALVGSSGGGKSTLLSLLLGHYNNYSGEIKVDDIEMRDVSLDSLYDFISIIQQNVFLFDSSIKNNITMFKDFEQEKLDSAVKLAGLSSLISEKGHDYECGEGGRSLSGGEKQRISISRCLVRETPVLLMDEATASLDNETAHEVTNAILDINGLTRIIVTHKLEENTMRKYDEIIVLKGGTIAERGSFTELMDKKEYFYSLYYVSSVK